MLILTYSSGNLTKMALQEFKIGTHKYKENRDESNTNLETRKQMRSRTK